MMLEVWVGMLNCEITETMPDGSRKRTLFTDQRHPSIATGMTILTDGDRYLEIGKSKDRLRLIVPDGNWEPFKGHDGRTQYKQNTKTIALVRA